MLDLVRPDGAGRRPVRLRRQAGFDEAGEVPVFWINAWYIKRQSAGNRFGGASNQGQVYCQFLAAAAAVALVRFLRTIAFH